MIRIVAMLASVLVTSTAHAGRPRCNDVDLTAGIPSVQASNELQRSAAASIIVTQSCSTEALQQAIQATLDDDASLLIAFGESEPRLWRRICPDIEPNQVTSELATSGCSVAHLGWSDAHFQSSMTAASMSEESDAAPFQFSPALASQQVARALAAQTLDRSRAKGKQVYLDLMAPISTEDRQQRAIRTAIDGLRSR